PSLVFASNRVQIPTSTLMMDSFVGMLNGSHADATSRSVEELNVFTAELETTQLAPPLPWARVGFDHAVLLTGFVVTVLALIVTWFARTAPAHSKLIATTAMCPAFDRRPRITCSFPRSHGPLPGSRRATRPRRPPPR